MQWDLGAAAAPCQAGHALGGAALGVGAKAAYGKRALPRVPTHDVSVLPKGSGLNLNTPFSPLLAPALGSGISHFHQNVFCMRLNTETAQDCLS